MQIDRIIFCVFLNKDWNYYADYLQFYFPCEEVKQQSDPATSTQKDSTTSTQKDTARSKEDTKEDNDGETEAQSELEAEVKNTDNIPSANLDDVIAMVEEDKKVAEAAKFAGGKLQGVRVSGGKSFLNRPFWHLEKGSRGAMFCW